MSTIGTMGSSSNSLLSLLNDLHLNRTIFKKVNLVTLSSVVGVCLGLI